MISLLSRVIHELALTFRYVIGHISWVVHADLWVILGSLLNTSVIDHPVEYSLLVQEPLQYLWLFCMIEPGWKSVLGGGDAGTCWLKLVWNLGRILLNGRVGLIYLEQSLIKIVVWIVRVFWQVVFKLWESWREVFELMIQLSVWIWRSVDLVKLHIWVISVVICHLAKDMLSRLNKSLFRSHLVFFDKSVALVSYRRDLLFERSK